MNPIYKTATFARGLTVLVMPAVHTVLLYSRADVYQSWWVYLLRFFAEGPGAQLFMFVMGLFITVGRTKSKKFILWRSIGLWSFGYLLNFFRIYLPAKLGLFPSEMLTYYGANPVTKSFLPLLLTGDILQFAGIAYGVVGWLNKLVHGKYYAFVLYLLAAAITPFCWGIRSNNLWIDHLLALICANDQRAFFPLLPWLCYPLAGMLSGVAFKHFADAKHFNRMALTGICMMLIGIGVLFITPSTWEGDFYRSSIGRTIASTGFILIWLYGIYRLTTIISEENPLSRFICFCSRYITSIYCIHWLIVCWSLPLAGFHQLNELHSLLAIVLISMLSFGIPFLRNCLSTKFSTIL